MSKDFNHTGKSMRKWALGSMASAYVRLKFSDSHPLANHQQESQLIEASFNKLADQVVSDCGRSAPGKNRRPLLLGRLVGDGYVHRDQPSRPV